MAADERTLSQSGSPEVLFGIESPERLSLRVLIVRINFSNAKNLLHHDPIAQCYCAQFGPIAALSNCDDVIDHGQRVSFVI